MPWRPRWACPTSSYASNTSRIWARRCAPKTLSITTGQPQTLFLDAKDRELVRGKSVVIVDDVISTGSTLQGIRLIMERAGANQVGEAAILTEGDRARWEEVIALGHLPVWVDDDAGA